MTPAAAPVWCVLLSLVIQAASSKTQSCDADGSGPECSTSQFGSPSLLQKTTGTRGQSKLMMEDVGTQRGQPCDMIAGVPVYRCEEGAAFLQQLQPSGKRENAHRWIIEFQQVSDTLLDDFCRAVVNAKGRCVHGHPSHRGQPFVGVIGMSRDDLAAILTLFDGADFIEHDTEVRLPPHEDSADGASLLDAESATPTWGIDRIDDSTGLDHNYGAASDSGSGAHVYVLDTGIRCSHQEFGGRCSEAIDVTIPGSQGTVVSCLNGAGGPTCGRDAQGHGTHCAGTVAGATHGVAPGARVYAVKVLGDDGSGSTMGILAAMDWITADASAIRPSVASMSLGGSGTDSATRIAVDAAVAAGVVVVVAAGNENTDACTKTPAFVPNAITVGSTTNADERSSFSNWGSCVDIFAPGSSIMSARQDSDTGMTRKSGTSMACPHVSGAAALILSQRSDATASDVTQAILQQSGAALIGDARGSPNRFLFVGNILAGSNPWPPPQPPPVPTAAPTPAPPPPPSSVSCGQTVSFETHAGMPRWSPTLSAPSGTRVTLSTCGLTNLDTVILQPCYNDDGCPGGAYQSQCEFDSTGSDALEIGGYNEATGSGQLRITCSSGGTPATTAMPTTAMPTTAMPTTAMPTTAMPTTAMPTTAMPSTTQNPNQVCVDVKMTNTNYGNENSWTLGTCQGSNFQDNQVASARCCLDPGVHDLWCRDSYGDGWHGGKLEINDVVQCEVTSGADIHKDYHIGGSSPSTTAAFTTVTSTAAPTTSGSPSTTAAFTTVTSTAAPTSSGVPMTSTSPQPGQGPPGPPGPPGPQGPPGPPR